MPTIPETVRYFAENLVFSNGVPNYKRVFHGLTLESATRLAQIYYNERGTRTPCSLSYRFTEGGCEGPCSACPINMYRAGITNTASIKWLSPESRFHHVNLYADGIDRLREKALTNPETTGMVEEHTCEVCGMSDDVLVMDEHALCTMCFSRYIRKCSECERYTLSTRVVDAGTYSETYFCEDCFTELFEEGEIVECPDCGAYIRPREELEIEGVCYCPSCFSEFATNCTRCGRAITFGDAEVIDDEYYCPDCASRERYRRYFHSYTDKPFPNFHGGSPYENPFPLFMGVELETSKRRDESGMDQRKFSTALHDLNRDESLFYQKADSSIGSEIGIEIITHPCTLPYHLTEFPWDAIIECAKENNYRSHDDGRCGLHVHVSKAALGETPGERELNTAKLMLLTEAVWPELKVFSRRHAPELNRFASMYPTKSRVPEKGNDIDLYLVAKNLHDEGHEGRYHAINVTNDQTVEFRFFRGSLNKETIFASLELVKVMCDYVMNHSTGEVQNAKWSELREAGLRYPEFAAYIQTRRGLTEGSEIPATEEIPDKEDFE